MKDETAQLHEEKVKHSVLRGNSGCMSEKRECNYWSRGSGG